MTELKEAFEKPNVMMLYGQTKHMTNTDKNQFYRTTFTSDAFSYCVFASERIIDMIKTRYERTDERRYLMDATFKVVPRLFTQLLVIHFETPTKHVTYFAFIDFFKFHSNQFSVQMNSRIIYFMYSIALDISIYLCIDDSEDASEL